MGMNDPRVTAIVQSTKPIGTAGAGRGTLEHLYQENAVALGKALEESQRLRVQIAGLSDDNAALRADIYRLRLRKDPLWRRLWHWAKGAKP